MADDERSSEAEENFKTTFGHYPIRVELPEPTPSAELDRFVHYFLTGRDDYKPNLKAVDDSDG